MDEHTIEADSVRVPGTLAHRDEVWDTCHADLMRRTVQRLEQEISRLGGDCAHVLSESIEPKHDGATVEAWLHGRFDYALYRLPVRQDSHPASRAARNGVSRSIVRP